VSLQETLFRRPPGSSWIILADSQRGIEAAGPGFIEHASHRGLCSSPLLVIHPGEVANADEPIGAQEGRFGQEPLIVSTHDVGVDALEAAAVVLMGGGETLDWVAEMCDGVFGDLMQRRIQTGGLILACGSAASALGEWRLDPQAESAEHGAGWLPGALILPGWDDPGAFPAVRELMKSEQRMYAVGLGYGSLLALGPSGEVEVWGEKPPNILLGKGWVST